MSTNPNSRSRSPTHFIQKKVSKHKQLKEQKLTNITQTEKKYKLDTYEHKMDSHLRKKRILSESKQRNLPEQPKQDKLERNEKN